MRAAAPGAAWRAPPSRAAAPPREFCGLRRDGAKLVELALLVGAVALTGVGVACAPGPLAPRAARKAWANARAIARLPPAWAHPPPPPEEAALPRYAPPPVPSPTALAGPPGLRRWANECFYIQSVGEDPPSEYEVCPFRRVRQFVGWWRHEYSAGAWRNTWLAAPPPGGGAGAAGAGAGKDTGAPPGGVPAGSVLVGHVYDGGDGCGEGRARRTNVLFACGRGLAWPALVAGHPRIDSTPGPCEYTMTVAMDEWCGAEGAPAAERARPADGDARGAAPEVKLEPWPRPGAPPGDGAAAGDAGDAGGGGARDAGDSGGR